ncbi:MAG: proline dehydrogenase family protein, partial [Alphaproteobacteria bacterium]|nr:proline dehydrogenase family protein [Alphaproteobacteria bacterium]
MIFDEAAIARGPLRDAVRQATRTDEEACVDERLAQAALPRAALKRIQQTATRLVEVVRETRLRRGGLDAFMSEYELSSHEGVVLMCLAEALLRIPDAETRDRLIADKVGGADWERHLGRSDSLFVNASTWALMLTGRLVGPRPEEPDLLGIFSRLVSRSGEPVIREALVQAMRILGRQFVMGRTIKEALERAQADETQGYRYSYDMLGEAARTMADAERYFESYRDAIGAIGRASRDRGAIESPGISVKLAALQPRDEFGQRRRVLDELVPRFKALALDA